MMIHMHVSKYLWSDNVLRACKMINRISSSVLNDQVSFSCLYSNKSPFSMTRVLFKTYLLVWINYPLGLSNVYLLGVIEFKKDTATTIIPIESILCLQMSRSLSLFHTSLHKVQLLHQNLSLFHRLFRYLHLLDVFTNVTRRHYNTSCTTGFKGFSICLYSSAKSSYLWTSFGWFLLSSGRSTPQLSVSPFDHDVLIALCKGKKSCIDHSISYLLPMIVLNSLFASLPFPCLLYLYPGHMRRLHWYRLEAGHDEEIDAFVSRRTWELVSASTDVVGCH